MKIIYLSIVVSLFFLISCEGGGQKVNNVKYPNQTDNYDVRFLFEVDGVRVYKFYNRGNEVYFTNTNGKTVYTESHTNGKIYTSETIECICNKEVSEEWNTTK